VSTEAVCLKGRRDEFGPRLEWAPDVVYVGRRCSMGGWRLAASPFANPFRVQDLGGAQAAVQAYRRHLLAHPELLALARRELKGKRLGCFCRAQSPQLCHAGFLAVLADAETRDLTRVMHAPLGSITGVAA
jgi:hypothetical protein